MTSNRRRPVALLAHVPYYRHAAVALHEARYLDRFLTMVSTTRPLRGTRIPGIGPVIEHVNRTRVFPDLKGVPIERLWVGQVASHAVQRVLDKGSVGNALPLRSLLWDADARGHFAARRAPQVLHAVSGVALHSARAAKAKGAFIVIDVRAPYPRSRAADIAPALARHGIDYRIPNEANLKRLEAEHDLADLLVCCSEMARRTFLDAGFDEDKVAAVDLGCDTDRFTPASSAPESFTVLFVGRERREKGYIDLARAVRALSASSKLVSTGERDESSTNWLRDVRASTEFVGKVPASLMPSLYHKGSVLALPSYSEGFGMVVIEAMSAGLPVIVSDHTGAADAVTDGVDGFIIPAGDSDALADRLRRFEADPDLVAKMGAAAREHAAAFSWSAYGRHLVALYEKRILPNVEVD